MLRAQDKSEAALENLFRQYREPLLVWLMQQGHPTADAEDVLQGFTQSFLSRDGLSNVATRLFIHRRCGRLAETLPGLQRVPNRPEDVLKVDADEDGVGGDDAADCLRYLVATKERKIIEMRLRGL